MARVFIGLGSNQGDRPEHLSRALHALSAEPGVRVVQMATIIETAPVGLPAPRPLPGIFYVYALKCNGGSYYIGQTTDLLNRWSEHQNGRIDWTKRHRPIEIAHFEVYSTREEAVRRERALKTGFGRKWLRKQIESGRARQAGGPPQGSYLNTAAELDTTLEPSVLLSLLKRIEQQQGRQPQAERWSPRPIDLDLLLYDDRILQDAALTLPHPRMHQRRFVLEPLAQLAPELLHPVLKRAIRDLCSECVQ